MKISAALLCALMAAPQNLLAASALKASAPQALAPIPKISALPALPALIPVAAVPAAAQGVVELPSFQARAAVVEPGVFDGLKAAKAELAPVAPSAPAPSSVVPLAASSKTPAPAAAKNHPVAPRAFSAAATPWARAATWARRTFLAATLVLTTALSGCVLSSDIPPVPDTGDDTYVPDDIWPITYGQIYQDIEDHFYDYDHTPGEYYGRITDSDNDRVYKVRLADDGFINFHVDEQFGVKYDLLVVDDDGDIVLRDNNWFDVSRPHEVIGDLPGGTYYVILHNNNDGALGETYWAQLYY